jgi:hypothetical protein
MATIVRLGGGLSVTAGTFCGNLNAGAMEMNQ